MSGNIAKVTSKGQVTIPKSIREQLHIREQDQLLFSVEGDTILVTPLRRRPLEQLRGSLPATKPFPGHDEIRDKLHKDLGERIGRGVE
jgi:antitoxin PrlF